MRVPLRDTHRGCRNGHLETLYAEYQAARQRRAALQDCCHSQDGTTSCHGNTSDTGRPKSPSFSHNRSLNHSHLLVVRALGPSYRNHLMRQQRQIPTSGVLLRPHMRSALEERPRSWGDALQMQHHTLYNEIHRPACVECIAQMVDCGNGNAPSDPTRSHRASP